MKKYVFKAAMLAFAATFMLAGCSSGTKTSTESVTPAATVAESAAASTPKPVKKLDQVALKVILPGDKPQHYDDAMKALNQKLTDAIQATLEIQYIPWDSFKDQLLVKLAAGENIDFFYDGYWMNYAQIISKSGAKDITDIFEKNAPDLYKGLTAEYVKSNKINGKIYGIPVPGPLEYPQGFNFRSDIAEKYGYNASNIKSIKDAEEFLKKAVAGEKANGRVGLRYNGEYRGDYNTLAFAGVQREYVPSNDFDSPGMLLNNEPKVINQFESQQYKDFLKIKKRWWDEELVDKESLFSKASVTTDTNSDTKAISAGGFGNAPEGNLGDNTAALAKIEPGAKKEYTSIEGDGFKMVSSFKAGNFSVISANSKNAERVLMFLNLIYKDKSVRDLYLYGEEGKDFIPVGDSQFKYPDGLDKTKVFSNEWWMVTPWANARIPATATDTDKKFIQQNSNPNNFTKSVISGFDFNPDAVKSEISKVGAVVTEFRKILESGSGTAAQQDAKYAEFIAKLKKAGVDKIIAEKQKQIDAFVKNKRNVS